MLQILGQNIQPLSCLIIYLNGLILVAITWWPLISAFWMGKPLEKPLSYLDIFFNICICYTFARTCFDAAYKDDALQKRIAYIGTAGGAVICLVLSCWFWWWGSTSSTAEADESLVKGGKGTGGSLGTFALGLLADGLVLGAAVEGEEWLKKRRMMKEEIREERKIGSLGEKTITF